MTCPTARALSIHSVLEDVFSDPRTWGYFGNNATPAEQTVEAGQPTSLTKSCDFPQRSARIVENGGRGAQ